jgi:DNA (cytosine-5)-methyltransferase 1
MALTRPQLSSTPTMGERFGVRVRIGDTAWGVHRGHRMSDAPRSVRPLMASTMAPVATTEIGSPQVFEDLFPTTGDSPARAVGSDEFFVEGGWLMRRAMQRNGAVVVSPLASWAGAEDGVLPSADAEHHLLRATEPPPTPKRCRRIPVVDLFAGCGGLSLGVREATTALGEAADFSAFDLDEQALRVYSDNFVGSLALSRNLAEVVDGDLGTRPTRKERGFVADTPCRLLVAGPPCQGHSAANNRTRHRDERNRLYLTAVRAAELLEPQALIIENVPGAASDSHQVVDRAVERLEDLGYWVDVGIVDASVLGVPQRRRRLLLLASSQHRPSIDRMIREHATDAVRTVRWAFEDLQDSESERLIDQRARSAPQTLERMDVLFDQDLYELPDEFRPPCHAKGGHSYVSIYGRLRWDEPAQTLTTGFYSMCMGRNVHPAKRRTITAHEAARIQGLPDWFSLDRLTKRVDLSRMIGNTVPPRLSFAATMELLR